MKKVFYGLLSLAVVSFVYGATIYRWVDKDGGVHFTEDYNRFLTNIETKWKQEKREIPGGWKLPLHLWHLPRRAESRKEIFRVWERITGGLKCAHGKTNCRKPRRNVKT